MMNKKLKTIFVILLIFIVVNVGNALNVFNIGSMILRSVVGTVFSSTYDTATPLGTDDPREADDRMREIKAAVQERENVDHYWPLTGTEVSDADTGEHRKVLFHAPITSPATIAESHGLFFIKDVAGKAELHWLDEDENEIQLTSVGKLFSSGDLTVTTNQIVGGTLDVTGNIDPTTYEATNGGFLDEDDMASDAADKVASQQSIKAFAGMVPAQTGALAGYEGEESVTFANGLIFKTGSTSVVDGATITFEAAFPTAIKSVVVEVSSNTAGGVDTGVTDVVASGFKVFHDFGSARTVYWQAWGR